MYATRSPAILGTGIAFHYREIVCRLREALYKQRNDRSVSMEQTGISTQGSSASGSSNGMDHSATRIRSAAHETVDRIANAARPAVDRFAETAHQTVDRVSTFATSAAGTLQQKRGEYGSRSNEMIVEAKTYVQNNPLKSIGIAAAVGYMLSRMMKSR
jgi:ElaB/YqjD/DUF883 family membrane-anchored ribosome-binding protein